VKEYRGGAREYRGRGTACRSPRRKGNMLMTPLEIVATPGWLAPETASGNILKIFRDPVKLAGETIPAKLLGALQITVIGMALTFVALILVWLAVRLLARFAAGSPSRDLKPAPPPRLAGAGEDEEKVAAIAAVLSLIAGGHSDRIRVKKIIRGPDGGRRWMDF